MNRAFNRCLFTGLPRKLTPIHPAVGWIVGNSPGSHANNVYSPRSDKLTEVQHVTCQLHVKVEKPFCFLIGSLSLQIRNKKGFSMSDRISSRVNTFYLYGRRRNSHFERKKLIDTCTRMSQCLFHCCLHQTPFCVHCIACF